MNECIKALAQEAYDLSKTGEAALAKSPLAVILPLVMKDALDVVGIQANLAQLKTDAQALLSNPAADADLIAFVGGLVGGEDAKVQKIVSACAKAVVDTISDFEAIKSAIAS